MNTPVDKPQHAYSPSKDNLRNLLLIRSIALLGQACVLGWVIYTGQAPTGGLLWVTTSLCLFALLTAASLWRTTRARPVADGEFLGQLLVDVLGWTALMYFTGGANNPFISYYIVPVVIAAAVLPWRYTWLVAGATTLAYSLLLYVYQPFPLFTPHAAMGHGDSGNVHILGMWFNFLFSVGLITFFVVRMAATLRRQEDMAVARREDRLRNDQIMAVASLAAGTAHELGTPLATMTVLVDEMLAGSGLDERARKDCELLQGQLAQCKATLSELSATAEQHSLENTRRINSATFARQTLERWAVRRPGTAYVFDCDNREAADSPDIDADPTLAQAMENLLNNAADTGSEKVAVTLHWNSDEVEIRIRDWGRGIDPEIIARVGRPMQRADHSGLGIGLMLCRASVERHGGRLALSNPAEGGALATITLPACLPAKANDAS